MNFCSAQKRFGAEVYENLRSVPNRPTIGLFDSGVGGLSVLKELVNQLPEFNYIYLGDTARLPYGNRSPETIIDFSMQAARFLISQEAESVVIACNTASSVALHTVKDSFPGVSVTGMVVAGARAAVSKSRGGSIAVIGTTCTVTAKAYERAVAALDATIEVKSAACPFLVLLAEEGWTDDEIAYMSVKRYISPLLESFGGIMPDSLILGCTHFTQFKELIQKIVGPQTVLIDPAESLAVELKGLFKIPDPHAPDDKGTISFYATDALSRFARVGGKFLGTDISAESVGRVNLDNQ
ncbi:glutamate racemase [Maridesulfovibrio ferrireducens]|uniref:Glutamate racemase n=1 Tax=Maridesulfovibrio ferrireducens TaxID=246191 RepID=A0A1G9AT91_9BACT|nr:glutamate racemase [Maridesulfovibrio ferrireducens]SDK30549.1 glutamate racemase [Maridesulfovibrio ferrireducens]